VEMTISSITSGSLYIDLEVIGIQMGSVLRVSYDGPSAESTWGTSLDLFSATLVTNNVTDISELYWDDGVDYFRLQIRSGVLYLDERLTPLGWDGIEDTDWENIWAKSVTTTTEEAPSRPTIESAYVTNAEPNLIYIVPSRAIDRGDPSNHDFTFYVNGIEVAKSGHVGRRGSPPLIHFGLVTPIVAGDIVTFDHTSSESTGSWYANDDDQWLDDYTAFPVTISVEGTGFELTAAYTTTQVTMKLKLPVGSSVTIYWGDGSTTDVDGLDSTLITSQSSYSGAGSYDFYLSGDVHDVTYYEISSQHFVSGDISGWAAYTSLTDIKLASTSVSGDVSVFSALTSIETIDVFNTDVSGDISGWSVLPVVEYIRCDGCTGITGDVSGYSALPSILTIRVSGTGVSGDISGWSVLTDLLIIYVYGTAVTGDISVWSTLTSLLDVRGQNTALEGNISGWSVITGLASIYLGNSSVTGNISGWVAMTNMSAISIYSTTVSGDISGFNVLTNIWNLALYDTNITGDISGLFTLTSCQDFYVMTTGVDFDSTETWTKPSRNFQAYNCGWTSTQVDNCLISLAAGPVINLPILIHGDNAARTAASDAAKATLLLNGCTVTVNE